MLTAKDKILFGVAMLDYQEQASSRNFKGKESELAYFSAGMKVLCEFLKNTHCCVEEIEDFIFSLGSDVSKAAEYAVTCTDIYMKMKKEINDD